MFVLTDYVSRRCNTPRSIRLALGLSWTGAGQIAQWLGIGGPESPLTTKYGDANGDGEKQHSMNHQVHLDDGVQRLTRGIKPATEHLLELEQKDRV